jgi:pimeloyl-ACP methyl ester carboxylesterase
VTVIRYDRRGYGRSLRALGEGPGLDVAGHVDDLLGIVAGRPVVLVGHSMGGDIALTAAAREPELVRAVVTYESPMAWEPWWPSHSAGGAAMSDGAGVPAMASRAGAAEAADAADAAERFLRRMIGDERWEALPPAVRESRRAEGRALVGELGALRARAPFDPEAVTMPVVAGRGSDSAPHHRRAMALLADRLPRGELHEIAGATHNAHVSHAAAFAGLLRRAIELGGSPGP